MTTETLTRRLFLSAPATALPAAPARPAAKARCRRAPFAGRLYDMAVSGLILLSASVALYRLIWMGQP
jgi:hypothetical protein